MTVTSLMTQSITIHRKVSATRDDIGGEATLTESPLQVAGYLEPMRSDEVDQNTHPRGLWRLLVAASTDMDSVDRVTYGTKTFEVVGPPRPMWNPRTEAVSHIEADLEEVT